TRPHVVEAGQAGEQQRGPQSEDAGGAEAVVAQDRSGCGVGARALDRRRRRRVGEVEQHPGAGGGAIGGDGGVPTEAPGVEGAEAADDRRAGGPGCCGQAPGERGPVAEAERVGPRMGGTAMCGGGDPVRGHHDAGARDARGAVERGDLDRPRRGAGGGSVDDGVGRGGGGDGGGNRGGERDRRSPDETREARETREACGARGAREAHRGSLSERRTWWGTSKSYLRVGRWWALLARALAPASAGFPWLPLLAPPRLALRRPAPACAALPPHAPACAALPPAAHDLPFGLPCAPGALSALRNQKGRLSGGLDPRGGSRRNGLSRRGRLSSWGPARHVGGEPRL